MNDTPQPPPVSWRELCADEQEALSAMLDAWADQLTNAILSVPPDLTAVGQTTSAIRTVARARRELADRYREPA